jgi:hypothetical protein
MRVKLFMLASKGMCFVVGAFDLSLEGEQVASAHNQET